jgi:hypothetical protein
MTQTKKKRGTKYRGSRKNILRGGIPYASKPSIDTKYATTMIKNIKPPQKPPKPSSNFFSSVCTEISDKSNKLASTTFAKNK